MLADLTTDFPSRTGNAETRSSKLNTPPSQDSEPSRNSVDCPENVQSGDIETTDDQLRLSQIRGNQSPGTRHFACWLDVLVDGDTTRLHSLMNGCTGLPSGEFEFDFSYFEDSSTHVKPLPELPVFSADSLSKVQQHWPVRAIDTTQPKPSFWYSIWTSRANIITDAQLIPPGPTEMSARWRLTSDALKRVQTYVSASTCGSSGSHGGTASVELPPNGIVDIGLELFFRHYHPLQPFIHVPTFHANSAPTATLISMCLIGFHILNTKGTDALLSQMMHVSTGHVQNEWSIQSSN